MFFLPSRNREKWGAEKDGGEIQIRNHGLCPSGDEFRTELKLREAKRVRKSKSKGKEEGLQVVLNDASCRSAKLKGNLLSNMPLLIIVFIRGWSCTNSFETFKIAVGKCVSSLASLLGRIETGLAVAKILMGSLKSLAEEKSS